jgi:prepilin-type N-terminal cleavage/methylation domain-containing protein
MLIKKGEDGFTLIELLLIIAIVGILATMSVPIIGENLKRWRTDQFARSVLTAHQAARFHAITKKTLIQVRYLIDQDKLNFYFCSDTKASGLCKNGKWNRYAVMSPLNPPTEGVELWSVGTKKSGEACMYYKPSGQRLKPQSRDGATGEGCPGGNSIGTGVHITWVPNPEVSNQANHCKWNTIFHMGNATSSPTLIPYGAYPNDDGPFQDWTIGDKPPCAG